MAEANTICYFCGQQFFFPLPWKRARIACQNCYDTVPDAWHRLQVGDKEFYRQLRASYG